MSRTKDSFEGVLHHKYNQDSFVGFVREFLNDIQLVAPNNYNKEYSNFSYYVDGYYHIGNFVTADDEKVLVLSVNLHKGETVERARSMQRNFVKPLIERSGCVAAIVAFFTSEELDKWRLSFIRLDYEFSKGKLSQKLTPAKRYSYLVGEDEPCTTALQRLFPIFKDENEKPTLDDIEEAFSVEKVTKDFFDKYVEKFHQVREYLESNEAFVIEAQTRGFTSEQFTKKLLGQIVFLYFIQKKGWLGVDAIPVRLNEKEFKNAFYAKGTKSREIIPKVYQQLEDGTYKINTNAFLELSDDDETLLAMIVKGKPWGSGPKDFMRQMFEGCKSANLNFFDDYLEPLFYTGLNLNRGENGFYPPLHRRIPFLNGGLFEQLDNYDWEHNDFRIPNDLFSNEEEKGKREADGILDIFDRYNFTMNEDEPMEREVAIDPEMLGKVFENLLDVKDRKSKGAFYTPREIVHYMCQETLINYLVNKSGISEKAIREFILYGEYYKDEDTEKTKKVADDNGKYHYEIDKDKELLISDEIFSFKKNVDRLKELDELLKNVKVADLAVGSGAFPLGMLNEIVKARETLTAYLSVGMNSFEKKSFIAYERKLYDLKVNTIKNSIFACDIEPSAVDIAKLRLWLSIVIDDEITSDVGNGEFNAHNKPRQLPNLDCNIICGNSLVESFKGIPLINRSDLLDNTSGVDYQYSIYQKGVDHYISKLIELQDKIFFVKDHNEKEELKQQIQDIYNQIIINQLGGDEKIIEEYYDSLNNPSRPFVLWQLSFPRVFSENRGFDIVIGNPPYIGERKHKDVFYAVQNSPMGRYYLGRMDFFYFFFHMALDLLNKGGTCSLITTNYYTTALGGRVLRTDFKDRSDIIELVNFNECKVFDTALGQHNMITTIQKGHTGRKAHTLIANVNRAITTEEVTKILRGGWESTSSVVNQEDLYDGIENYIRLYGVQDGKNPINDILNKMVSGSTDTLGNVCNPLIGLESSLDEVYVIEEGDVSNIIEDADKELPYVKMFFKGSQIHRYQIEEKTDKYILYLHEQIPDIKDLPGIWEYLKEHEHEIKARKGANLRGAFRRGNWWVLNTPRLDMDFNSEKIVTHYRTKSLRFALSTTPWYASRDVYYIVKNKENVSLKYILALLNSSLYYQWFYYRGKRKGDTLELYAKPLKETPIKEIDSESQRPFIDLVDTIMLMKKENQDTSDLEKKIDYMVYELYGLSDEEIDYIEKENYRYGRD